MGLLTFVDKDGNGTIDYNEFVNEMKFEDAQTKEDLRVDPNAHKRRVHQHAEKEQVRARKAAHKHAAGRRSQDELLEQIKHKWYEHFCFLQPKSSGSVSVCLTCLSPHCSHAQSKHIRKVFRRFDEDKSGRLSMKEFKRGLHHMGLQLSAEEMTVILRHMDKNIDGHIDYREFVQQFAEPELKHSGHGHSMKRQPTSAAAASTEYDGAEK